MEHVARRRLRIALNAARRLGRASMCRLSADLDRWLPAPDRPLEALASDLGVTVRALRRAYEVARDPDAVAKPEIERAEALGATVVTLDDLEYPPALGDLALPPPVLYVRGTIPEGPAVALVGSRRCTRDGRDAAELFAQALAEAGVTVVSGFARGIDAAAHRGALAGGASGATVAVLGCGLAIDYPKGHRKLGDRIVDQGGALVSEFPCRTPPRPWSFPIRNRLIAAMSAGVLVVQATHRSGSLITARQALELGRDVWAVPGGPFDEKALGTNALIRDGAPLVMHPKDILEALRLDAGSSLHHPLRSDDAPSPPDAGEPILEGFQGRVFGALTSDRPRSAEDVARGLDETVDRVLGTLLELELLGRVRRDPGPVYRRSTP